MPDLKLGIFFMGKQFTCILVLFSIKHPLKLSMLSKKNTYIIAICCFLVSGTLLLQDCSPKNNNKVITADSASFVGSVTCQKCHAKEFADWQVSDHQRSMLPANDSSVLGDFNDKSFEADGVKSRFFKKDNKFYINTQDGEGNYTDFEVKYTFGYYPLQQYLIEFPAGKMQATRVSWDSKNKKWFHQYPNQKIPPHDWMHWTGNAQNWNTMCAACHSTNLQKKYDVETDTYHTTYNEINVSCENCHGAGKSHLDYINGDYKKGNKIPGSMIKMEKGVGQIAQINNCAPCHARAASITAESFNPGHQTGEIMDHLIPDIPSDEHYYADGQANEEDYIYTSFAESKMFRHGIKCSNCHNPHTGKTIFPGNNLCMQCHAPEYNQVKHTMHQTGTEGAECKNCHMPGKLYMGNDLRNDHTFRVPRPDLTVLYGTPNACNNCHNGKSAKWAADAIVKNYGSKRKYHFAEDLIPGSKRDAKAEPHLLRILNDTSAPEIIQATALHYLANHTTQNSANALLKALNSKDAQMRYRALKSLDALDANTWMNTAGILLTDKVRAVRIAAAELYNNIPADRIPSNFYPAFTAAKQELEKYLYYQTDFAIGNVMLGDFYLKQKDYTNTEKFYLRALKKDSTYNYVRTNLSASYNAMGRNSDALKVLLEANRIDPKNENIYYNLALLYFELNMLAESDNCFAKAVALNSPNPRVYYNYGILLQQKGNRSKAESILLKGLQLSPLDAGLNYALSLMYLQLSEFEKAMAPALILKKNYPPTTEYQQLFQRLGI